MGIVLFSPLLAIDNRFIEEKSNSAFVYFFCFYSLKITSLTTLAMNSFLVPFSVIISLMMIVAMTRPTESYRLTVNAE